MRGRRSKLGYIMLVSVACNAALLATLATLAAQAPRITMEPPVHVSTAHPGEMHAETFVAINPRRPRNLVAAAMVDRAGPAWHLWSDVYASFDGGRTWTQGQAPAGDTLVFRGGDPVVFFDSEGTAFFARYERDGVLLSRSTDGGRTWRLLGTVAGPPFDRPFLVAGHDSAKSHTRIYAVANGAAQDARDLAGADVRSLGLMASADSGRTFTATAMLAMPGDKEKSWAPGGVVVLPDGRIALSFNTYTDSPLGDPMAFGDGRVGIAVLTSSSGLPSLTARLGPAMHWGPGGLSWQNAAVPRIALDTSATPSRGRLYVAWTDYDAVRRQHMVKVAASADTGKTWSPAVVVNDDSTRGSMVTPAIAVNKDGVVGVTWNDHRDDPRDRCYRLYFAASLDGGRTFLPNMRATDAPTCPLAVGNWRPYLQSEAATLDSTPYSRRTIHVGMSNFAPRYMSGGDTQGLVADSAGVFHAVWISGATGVMQLWAQRFTVTTAARTRIGPDSNQVDLTDRVDVAISDPAIDAVAQTLSMTVRLTNRGIGPLAGPLMLVLDDATSTAFREVRARNADNKRPARGASWQFGSGSTPPLLPGQTSAPRVLTWSIAGPREPGLGDRDPTPEPLQASFVVLGPATRTSQRAARDR